MLTNGHIRNELPCHVVANQEYTEKRSAFLAFFIVGCLNLTKH